MKFFGFMAAIFGLTLIIALTAYFGFASVIQDVASTGWGVVLVIFIRAAVLAAAGIGWWCLFMPATVRGPIFFIGIRFIREAINSLFPVAQVGGDIIGARLLTLLGVNGTLAIASVFIDIFIQVACLLIFVLAGLGILLNVVGSHDITSALFFMLAIATPAMVGFFLALNFGVFEPFTRRLIEFGEKRQWTAFHNVIGLGKSLQHIWRNHLGLLASFFVHLATLFFGASEVWVALAFLGHPVSLFEAVAIESLGQASRAAAFAIPGAYGVQDGIIIIACGVFGVPAEIALALALMKRIAELLLGVPGLLVWQVWEGKRLLSKRKKALSGRRSGQKARLRLPN
jgi:putative membrane protein